MGITGTMAMPSAGVAPGAPTGQSTPQVRWLAGSWYGMLACATGAAGCWGQRQPGTLRPVLPLPLANSLAPKPPTPCRRLDWRNPEPHRAHHYFHQEGVRRGA